MPSFERVLVTSALPYANGHIHLGHIAGAYLPADIYVRYQRLRGRPVLYVCGSDEHGVPITLTALKEGSSPQEVIDRYHTANAAAFQAIGISFDIYGRTSWPLHHDTTQTFFRRLYESGYIFTETMELWYSEQSQRFLPDRYVKGECPRCGYAEANADECEACGAQYSARELKNPRANIPGDSSTPVLRPSKHWFLDLPKFAPRLRAWLDNHTEWRPNVRGIAYSWVNDLRPRCITRDTDWGVPIPLDDPEAENKRIYVWFDAPIGYVTNTRQWGIDHFGDAKAWETWWKNPTTRLIHFIGKDNVPFHAVIFPAMLMGQGDYILPDAVVGNEYLNIFNRRTGRSEKGSKSRGNMITVRWITQQLRPDAVRYYLCAIAPESKDSDFDWDEFMNRYNGELRNIVGNFIHRVLTMTAKHFANEVPPVENVSPEDAAVLETLPQQWEQIADALEGFRFRQALERWVDLARTGNVYFDAQKPWVTSKTDMARTATTLGVCCRIIRALAYGMCPFIPHAAERLFAILNLPLPQGGPEGGKDAWDDALAPFPRGHRFATPEILFPPLPEEQVAALAEIHLAGKAQ